MEENVKIIALLSQDADSKKLLASHLMKQLHGQINILNTEIGMIKEQTPSQIFLVLKSFWVSEYLADTNIENVPTHIFYINDNGNKGNSGKSKKGLTLFNKTYKNDLEDDPRQLTQVVNFLEESIKYKSIFRKYDLSASSITDIASQILALIEKDVALLSPKKITLSNTMNKGDLFLLSKKNFDANSALTSDYIVLKPKIIDAPYLDASYIEKHFCHFNNIGRNFSLDKFNELRSPPVSIGLLDKKSHFDVPMGGGTIQIQNMPIAFPSFETDHEYRIPRSYEKLSEFIQKVINFWYKFEPNARKYYAYLSLSHDAVPPWKSQRIPGIHCEGFQSHRPYKTCEYTFTCVNSLPPVYYIQSFDANRLNPNESFFKQFAQELNQPPLESQAPYEITMMDPYCFHSDVINSSDVTVLRTFARIIYSSIKYDRSYNTHNFAFDYEWNREVKRDPY